VNVAALKITTPTDREIVITRVLDAPRALVFECYTKPELLKRWLNGPDGWQLVVCDSDFRVGGAYRWVWRGPGGIEMALSGVHREIVRPERIVRTELFDNCPGGESVGTLLLTEADEATTVTMKMLYASQEARDGALKSGMEKGVSINFNKLAELLVSMPDREQHRRSA
jgi:uncharacterized protein YndB with AHSA1/START domain